MNMWIHIGSNNEDSSVAGISHFIEHMLFKGTEKYKVGDIAKEIETLGGYLNGFTSYDATAYQITVPVENTCKALDILLDVLENSSFDPVEIEKEARVIIEECRMRDDTPHVCSWENLMKLAFNNHRYGRSIIGEEEIIKKLTRDDLLGFLGKTYIPENMSLIITGDVDIKILLEKLEKFSLRKSSASFYSLSPQEEPQKTLRYNYFTGDIERTYIDMGFRIPNQLHYDSFVIEILSAIMGEGRSSRLYREIKEKRQLATQINTGDVNGREAGLFMISAVTDEDKAIDTLKAIWSEIEKIKKEPLSEEEFEKTRNSIEHDYIFDQETVDGQADKIGHFVNLGDYSMSVKYLDILKRIPPEDINNIAKRYFTADNCSISIYGPGKNNKDIKLDITPEEMEKIIADRGNRDSFVYSIPEIQVRKEKSPPVKMKLKKGITLIAERDSAMPVASFYAGFKGGVRFETKEKNGLCRFMTRLLIKGTQNLTAGEIATGIESLGSYLMPRAGKDSFGLSMSILKKYKDKGMELFFDVLSSAIFPEEEVEKERKFILA